MNLNIDARKLMHRVTFHVTAHHEREMRWRMWLGAKLMILGAIVMGCPIEIVTKVNVK